MGEPIPLTTTVYFIVVIFFARSKILPLDVGVVVVVAFEVVDVATVDVCVVFDVVCVADVWLEPLQDTIIRLIPTKQATSR